MRNLRASFLPSIDTLLLILLVGAYIPAGLYIPLRFIDLLPRFVPFSNGITSVVIAAILLYWLVSSLHLPERIARQRQWLIKLAIVAFVWAMIVIGPTVQAIQLRRMTGPHTYAHDGLVSSEVAVQIVLNGKNPYIETYEDTPLADWPFTDDIYYPALEHYAYMPVMFMLPLPFQVLGEAIWGWFDQRILYLALFAGMLIVAAGLVTRPRDRLMLIMALGLNPLLAYFVVEGRNEIVVLFFLVLAIKLLQRDRTVWSGIVLGVACATKQFAWFFFPFFVIALLKDETDRGAWLSCLYRPVLAWAATFGVLVLPWFLWSPAHFLDDIVGFQTGVSTAGYQIGGFGFSALLLMLGGVTSRDSQFPFLLLSVVICLPLLIILLVGQYRSNNLSNAAGTYAFWLFVFTFFSRVFTDNYLGYILTFVILSIAIAERENPSKFDSLN